MFHPTLFFRLPLCSPYRVSAFVIITKRIDVSQAGSLLLDADISSLRGRWGRSSFLYDYNSLSFSSLFFSLLLILFGRPPFPRRRCNRKNVINNSGLIVELVAASQPTLPLPSSPSIQLWRKDFMDISSNGKRSSFLSLFFQLAKLGYTTNIFNTRSYSHLHFSASSLSNLYALIWKSPILCDFYVTVFFPLKSNYWHFKFNWM